MSGLALIVLNLLLAAVLTMPARAQDLVLTNARIIDPASRTVVDGALWIQGGRIAGQGAQLPADAPGKRIDLGGKFVMPGLVDMHVHSHGNHALGQRLDDGGTQETAERVLRAGVIAFLDLFSDEDYILSLRNRQRAGAFGGAEILAAGPCFTATGGHCSEYRSPTRLINSPAQARQQLAELLPKRPDVIKVVYGHPVGPDAMPSIDEPTLVALLSGAREAGIKTIVHVATWEDVRHAVRAGASAVTHVPRGRVVPDDVVSLMAAQGTYHIPTLVVHTDMVEFLENPALLDAPLFKAMTEPALRAAYKRGVAGLDQRTRMRLPAQRAGKTNALESVRRLHAAGVPMLTGTDAGNPGVIHGYSVHRELLRLQEAGLSAWNALAASTTTAGKFLGRKFGVQPGDEANLLVLAASPIENIANTQSIELVIQRGRVVYDR